MIETYVIGHLGQDCRVTDVNGKKVINFSLANTNKFKDQNGQTIEKTLWIDCAHWNDNTRIAEYLIKGAQIFVRGVPTVGTYKNQHGITVAQFRIRVDFIQLLGGKRDQQYGANVTRQENQQLNDSARVDELTDPEDLPF